MKRGNKMKTKKIKKVAFGLLFGLSLTLSFCLGAKFTLNNQKIITYGGTHAESHILFYHKEYYVNPHHINWGAIID